MDKRRFLPNFDRTFFVLALVLTGIGLLNLYSATYAGDRTEMSVSELWSGKSPLFVRQVAWAGVGMVVLLVSALWDYRRIANWSYPAYALGVAMLLFVWKFGATRNGSTRWIELGPVSFQPSEVMKIFLVMSLARFFRSNEENEPYYLRNLLLPFAMIALPAALIIEEPDLGTAVILTLASLSVILFVGVRWKSLALVAALGLAVGPFAGPYAWNHVLKDYQKKRVLSMLGLTQDPMGADYQQEQAKIAVGSGQTLGKAWMHGTQGALRFVPEHHTDFIFSILAEEWGFFGVLTVLSLFLGLILWGILTSLRAKDRYGRVLAIGATSILFWHVAFNLNMVKGPLPVVGVPLPFFSYGGSFLVATLLEVGLLINVSMRRFMF